MRKMMLRKYARLIVQVGGNVQPGQEVVVSAGLDQPEFVAMVVEECYRRGAKKVTVDWSYQPVEKLHWNYRSLETVSRVEEYEEAKLRHYVDVLPCRIYLDSSNPDGLKGVDQQKMAQAQRSRYPILKPYRDKMESRYQWCIAAVPGAEWAKKMFPQLRVSQAIEALWIAILDACRVGDSDPVAEWERHDRSLKEHCAYLNGLSITELHYTSANGTDFTVGLIPHSRFLGGGDKTLAGVPYTPNMPTEECFISPMRGRAEGIVYGTKPLSHQGQLVEGFWIRFHEGRAVEWHADTNESLLTRIITMDEGSAYLGECALVPYNSPVSMSGLLFYNTLFDENAACHLALGDGFADTLEGFENMTLAQCHERGVNESMVHKDFMIGSADMDIDAVCADGTELPVFRNGGWAF